MLGVNAFFRPGVDWLCFKQLNVITSQNALSIDLKMIMQIFLLKTLFMILFFKTSFKDKFFDWTTI